MEEIDITKHPEHNTKKHHKKSGVFNIVPLIIIGLVIYIIAYVDLRSFFESEQLKKNVSYIKNLVNTTIDKYSTEFKSIDFGGNFLEAPVNGNTNKTSNFNLNNFLQIPNPELDNLNNSSKGLQDTYPDNSTTGYRYNSQIAQ